jgi:alpha-methylacyl-CoA racemase
MHSAPPDPASLPLIGLRVVELHAIGPVPFAAQLLRSLGAKVTRVSPLNDPGLGVPMPAKFDLLNAGKEIALLDLKAPLGRAQLFDLLGSTDVLLEGFRPGVLERLGLAPNTLLDKYPKLVIGRLSGWGSQGPLAARAGHDINYLALTGVLHAIGGKQQPVPPLNLVADFGGGAMHLLVGVLAKLVQRSLTGRGGAVETSITAGTIGLTPMFYGMLADGRWNLERENNLLDGGLPCYRVYACADGKHVAVGALEPKFFAQLLSLTETNSLIRAEDQYKSASWPAIAAVLTQRFATKSRDQWAALADQLDACVSPVLDFVEASTHPQALANHWFSHDAQVVGPQHMIRFD